MKKVLVILAICGLLAIITTSGITLLTGEDTQSVKDWKIYPLSLVDNSIDKKADAFVKVLTPLLIEKNQHLPGKFAVYAKGKVDGVEVSLIDENGNGKYNEIGTDTMVIGDSHYGVPLSRIINIKNKLYECNVDSGGKNFSLKPYEDKYGELDFVSNFKCPTKLNLAILNSDDIYIDVANNKKVAIPCGAYKLWLGYIEEGTSHVAIKQNKMENIEVTEEFDKPGQRKLTTVNWGASFKIDFDFTVKDNKVQVPYGSLKVFGNANEEYYHFIVSLFPQIEVIDSKGALVAKGAFSGC